MPHVRFRIALALIAVATLVPSLNAHAGMPYEMRILQFMARSVETFVVGEFAGRQLFSNIDVNHRRPICRPDDYDELRATNGDQHTFVDFYRRCKIVDGAMDHTHVYATVHLPSGFCEPLRQAYLSMLKQDVFPESSSEYPEDVMFAYKGALFGSTSRSLARGAQLGVACLDNGTWRISAPRERPIEQTSQAAPFEGTPLAFMYLTARDEASNPITIVCSLLIALAAPRLTWALAGAVIFAALEWLALHAFVAYAFGSSRGWTLWDLAGPGFSALPYLAWVAAFFALKQLVRRTFRFVRLVSLSPPPSNRP